MSAPREHPIGRLIELAEESARIMWRAYDAHLSMPRIDPEWEQRALVIYQRCVACDSRVWKLKELREQSRGQRATSS
jgi:hypothetical protein